MTVNSQLEGAQSEYDDAYAAAKKVDKTRLKAAFVLTIANTRFTSAHDAGVSAKASHTARKSELKKSNTRENQNRVNSTNKKIQSVECELKAAASELAHKKARYKTAKANFDQAERRVDDAIARLSKVLSNDDCSDDKKIAERVGVPTDQLERIVVRRQDHAINVYYGGVEKAMGVGHAHIVLRPWGVVTYSRPPHRSTSPEYFSDEREYIRFISKKGSDGGYGLARQVHFDGKEVTVALGWGRKEGVIAMTDGHVDKFEFHDHCKKSYRRMW